MKNYYAVRRGYSVGVYDDLDDAMNQVRGYSHFDMKGFDSYNEAVNYVDDSESSSSESDNGYDYGDNDMVCYINGRRTFKIYTDGACSNNQDRDLAKAGVGVYGGPGYSFNLSKPLEGHIQTNQRAELQAILEAMRMIAQRNDFECYQILTDSAYAINCLTVWAQKWVNNGWTNSLGATVANKDIIMEILEIDEMLNHQDSVTFTKVRAHSGDEGNEEADNLARQGIYN